MSNGLFKSLWAKFFVLLLIVSAVSLSAALYLRTMMLRDFDAFLDGQRLDHAYIVTAELEGAYEEGTGWDRASLVRNVARALMLGIQVQVRDAGGIVVMDTNEALDGLSPLMRRRVVSLAGDVDLKGSGDFVPYPMFLGGERIGTLDVRFLGEDRNRLFVERSAKFLFFSLLVMGGLAALASFLVSRKLTDPIKVLVRGIRAIRGGDLKERIPVASGDEIGTLTIAFNDMVSDLELQEELRRKLIANVAHELRTPIAAMRAELEAMLDEVLPLDKDQVGSLHEETGRLAFILDGIDSLTQAQASSLSLNRQVIEVVPLMKNIADRFQARALEEGISFEVLGGKETVAWVDPERLSQIIINLVGNAMRATPEGGTVTLAARENADGVEIEVLDTGGGIPVEVLPHIFERFYRGVDGGLGLGLPIVKELVDAHGGEIAVTSEEGRGTVVKVLLPSRS